jgi:hypothetical protein
MCTFSSNLTTERDRRKNVAAKQTLDYGGLSMDITTFIIRVHFVVDDFMKDKRLRQRGPDLDRER